MIKFIEISETKLKFASYPTIKLISLFLALAVSIPLLLWFLFFSPIKSSLICHKTTLKLVDCQLKESSLLNSNVTKINIKNLRKANKDFFTRGVIDLKANPHFLSLNLVVFQKIYYYPSNSFALVLWKHFNPHNWFVISEQINRINDFIRGKLKQQTITLEQKFNWIELMILGYFVIVCSLMPLYIVVRWLLVIPIKTIYEFDAVNNTLTIFQNKIFKPNIIKQYDFDRINQIKLDKDKTKNIVNGTMILQFNPDYDYPIDEFRDFEHGEQNFKIIQDFIKKHQ